MLIKLPTLTVITADNLWYLARGHNDFQRYINLREKLKTLNVNESINFIPRFFTTWGKKVQIVKFKIKCYNTGIHPLLYKQSKALKMYYAYHWIKYFCCRNLMKSGKF